MANANPIPPPLKTMESAVARIVGRELTADERQMLVHLRDEYGYDDDDPLVVVLAMTGALKVMIDDLPEKLQKASNELTELHRTGLREQSSLIAKDLVGVVASQIHASGRSRKARIIDVGIGVGVGALMFSFGSIAVYIKFLH